MRLNLGGGRNWLFGAAGVAAALAGAGAATSATGGTGGAAGGSGAGGGGATQAPKVTTPLPKVPGKEVATFAGGCFWSMEAIFQKLKGVEKAYPGYAGGHVANPTYEAVCSGKTGHAESVQVIFDPRVIPYAKLVEVFLSVHDPTTLNRQGADIGTQYRSAIFYADETQKKAAQELIRQFEQRKVWNGPIVTSVEPYQSFYKAEEFHLDYFKRNPGQGYCRVVVAPKVGKFEDKFRDWLKAPASE